MDAVMPWDRQEAPTPLSSNPLIARALRYMMDNSHEEISLDILSQQLRCSKFYLVKSFRIHLNITPMRWLLQYRLLKAATRLQQQEPIAVVNLALDCGFNSHSHFSTLFRKYYKCSPSEYQRRAHWKNVDAELESGLQTEDEMLLESAFDRADAPRNEQY